MGLMGLQALPCIAIAHLCFQSNLIHLGQTTKAYESLRRSMNLAMKKLKVP
jgi:hypothetical protein